MHQKVTVCILFIPFLNFWQPLMQLSTVDIFNNVKSAICKFMDAIFKKTHVGIQCMKPIFNYEFKRLFKHRLTP